MAHYAKLLSLLFLLVLSLHIEARESKFFTEVIRNSTNNNVTKSKAPLLAPTPAPAPAPAKSEAPLLAPTPAPAPAKSEAPLLAPAPAPLQSEYGYGLYGHESTEFPPTKTTTIADDENEIPTEDHQLSSTIGYKEYDTGRDAYNNNNNYYNNNNGYSNYNNNGYNDNGYVNEKQGISDTRFLENGKYFYDFKGENYHPNGYESLRESVNINERYYGNSENTNEFNTMEEYERQEGYPESQKEYVP